MLLFKQGGVDLVLAEIVFVGIVGGDDEQFVLCELVNEVTIQLNALGVEVRAGFVEQEKGALRKYSESQFYALFHTTRIRRNGFVGSVMELNMFDDFFRRMGKRFENLMIL